MALHVTQVYLVLVYSWVPCENCSNNALVKFREDKHRVQWILKHVIYSLFKISAAIIVTSTDIEWTKTFTGYQTTMDFIDPIHKLYTVTLSACVYSVMV